MPGLQWCRMDTGLPSHPKMLALLADPSPKRYQAAASVAFAVLWSAGQATDGHIPPYALPVIHATRATAALLVKHGFWTEAEDGWDIHNFDVRQELTLVTDTRRAAQRQGGSKGNCRRWHGPHCWRDGACSRDDTG